jgi:hypothetical protein
MIAKSRIAAAALFALTSLPALAADAQQSAMAGDPTWPAVAEVAPSIPLEQGPSTPSATEVDPTWSAARVAPTALTLHQEPLLDDPLQGFSDTGARYAASAVQSAPVAAENTTAAGQSAPAVACAESCECHHG